jgi:hypothetical protein
MLWRVISNLLSAKGVYDHYFRKVKPSLVREHERKAHLNKNLNTFPKVLFKNLFLPPT